MKYMIAAGAMAFAALGLAGAANAAPSGPVTAAQTVNSLAGPGLSRDPEQGRHGTTRPVRGQLGTPGPDLFTHGFRGAWSEKQHRHDRHGENRVRRRRVLIIRTADRLVRVVVRGGGCQSGGSSSGSMGR